ncbi:MAG: Crp/Fnr family transcriptional regulator [Candidatus Acidiferrales bacterium]
MPAVHRLKIVESLHKTSYRSRAKSGSISTEVVKRLAPFAITACHPRGTVLFAEGQPSRGVFILCSGRVKLFTASPNGKTFILRFADPGEILGLAGSLSGQPYEAWAEATQPTRTHFVERSDLVHVMRRHGEVAVQVATQLGESYYSAIAGVRVMGHSRSASQKLATFLLDWWEGHGRFHDRDAGALFTSTHEEIAEVIGVSRETVTRVLARFKKKGLIRWKGRSLFLADRVALESSAAT